MAKINLEDTCIVEFLADQTIEAGERKAGKESERV
jgi:hypothetical protein